MKAKDILNWVGPETMADGKKSVAHYEHRRASAFGVLSNDHAWAVRKLLTGWALYAEAHKKRSESLIGDDMVLGPAWAEIGKSLLRLLDGELGGWDAGSLDTNIRKFAKAHGCEDLEC